MKVFKIFLDSDGCADGERRIMSRSNGSGGVEGRVEVCFNGLWGAIYSVSTWNISQVGVICNGLGYEPSGKYILVEHSLCNCSNKIAFF